MPAEQRLFAYKSGFHYTVRTAYLYRNGGTDMAIETTYTQARERLADYFDRAVNDCEVIIVQRRGHRPVAIIAADELASLMETAHLLSSPVNAERLFAALESAYKGEGTPFTSEQLRQEAGLEVDTEAKAER